MTARAPRDSAQVGPLRVEKLGGVAGGKSATPAEMIQEKYWGQARNAIDWRIMRQTNPTLAAMLANSINAARKVPSVEAPGGKER
jgi:hypothetical protein